MSTFEQGTVHCALVDVQSEAIQNTADALRPFGMSVQSCKDLDELLELIGEEDVHAVLVDIARLVREPVERLFALREANPTLPIILIGNSPVDTSQVESCLRHGADSFQSKPIVGLNLERDIRSQLRRHADDQMIGNQETKEHQKLVAQVLQAKREFENIFDAMPWPMILISPEGLIQRANLATVGEDSQWIRQILGRPAHDDLIQAGKKAIAAGNMLREGMSHACTVDGVPESPVYEIAELFSWPIYGENHAVLGSVHLLVDRSRIHRLEVLLQEQEKQSTIGLLASGLAHNLNSPLQALLGKLQIMEMVGTTTPEDQEFLKRVAVKMQDMVGNLMYKLRRDKDPERRAVSINELILSELKLMEANMIFKHEVSCTVELDPELEPVMAIHGDISQALNNLLNNAVDAMFGCTRKDLLIRTIHSKDGYSRVEIHDSGHGIPKELHDRVWESFFTTKPVAGEAGAGEPTGTGLGLASSRYLLRKYGMGLDFTSDNEGTIFSVSWKRSDQAK